MAVTSTPVTTGNQTIPFISGFPGSVPTPSRSSLYVDSIPVAQVALPASSAQQAPSGQRFWSSEPRAYGDPSTETMVLTFSSPQLINYVTLDLPHFPHQAQIAYCDEDGNWNWLAGLNGSPLQFISSGSVPAQINSAAALAAGLNPYHFGAGHWIHHDESVTPVSCTGLLLAGNRTLQPASGIFPGQLPVDASGNPAPYPLGLRNFDFGYRVRSRSDVPYTPRSPTWVTERQPFATASDVNGTPVQLTLRENRASDLLNGQPWKCGPQPVSAAVVNLYVDSRDPLANSQVIDRFYVNPTTSGVNLNLYYTTTAPAGSFTAVDTPLGPSTVTVTGSIPPVPDPEGLIFPKGSGCLSAATQGFGGSFGQPWWTGWEIQPQFGSLDSGSYMICDTGIVQLSYADGYWLFSLGAGNVLATWPATHAVNDRLRFAAGWDGSQLYCWSQQAGGMATAPASSLPPSGTLLFGAPQAPAWGALNGNFRLTSWIMKQEAPLPDPLFGGVPDQWLTWGGDPHGYTAPSSGPASPSTTDNACARFDLSLILGDITSGLAPYGFAGGLGTAWSSCTWIPVQLSYQMSAGYIQFPPVTAAGFRFEFTNLAPVTYDFNDSAPQNAQLFQTTAPTGAASSPPMASPAASSLSAARSGANSPVGQVTSAPSADTGLLINQQLAPLSTYIDAPAPQAPPAPGSALPTEALYATDPLAALQLAQGGGSLFNFQPWQASPQGAQKQVTTGQQSYQQVTLPQTSKIAYFVGLSQLTMYRVDYSATSDTAEYIDTFGDTAAIAPAALSAPSTGTAVPWTWSPNLLQVPVSLPPGAVAQLYSPVYNSAHTVTAVQFAAVQSPPVQLLPDPSFTNTALPFVTAIGDALPLAVSAAASSPVGSLVTVSRQGGLIAWSAAMASYPLWSSFTSPVLTWAQVEGPNIVTSPYGGMAYTGAPIPLTAAGRVHIAARVFAAAALSAPLYLQLLDGATGVPIAQEPVSVSGGVVTEWFASFTIGEPQAPSTLTWTQVQAAYATWAATAGQTWSTIDTSIPALGTTVSWQLVQYGATDDTWGVDNVSIFEDAIVWEFSNNGGNTWYPAYDINANPSGALVFPPALASQGLQLQWRVLGYRPNLTVSSLAIRPWYSIYPRGVPPRVSGIPHGPNVQAQDYYTTIDKDPYWQTWSNPIPQDWYWTYQQLLQQNTTYVQLPAAPLPVPVLVLGRGLVVPQAETPIGPETFTDQYSDPYGFFYGTPDSSNVYTDDFGNDIYNANEGYTP
jgi:hypothetical protein